MRNFQVCTYFESMLRKAQRAGVESLVSWIKMKKNLNIDIKKHDLKHPWYVTRIVVIFELNLNISKAYFELIATSP